MIYDDDYDNFELNAKLGTRGWKNPVPLTSMSIFQPRLIPRAYGQLDN